MPRVDVLLPRLGVTVECKTELTPCHQHVPHHCYLFQVADFNLVLKFFFNPVDSASCGK